MGAQAAAPATGLPHPEVGSLLASVQRSWLPVHAACLCLQQLQSLLDVAAPQLHRGLDRCVLALQIELQIENELNEWVEQQVKHNDGRSVLTLLGVLHLPSAWAFLRLLWVCWPHYGLCVRQGEPGRRVHFLVSLALCAGLVQSKMLTVCTLPLQVGQHTEPQ